MATENLSPAVISRLMGEIRDLVRKPVEGVEYVPNEDGDDCVSEVHAIITGPGKLRHHIFDRVFFAH
jgi:ubiquitin-protein ligase